MKSVGLRLSIELMIFASFLVFMYHIGEIAYFYDSKPKLKYKFLDTFCISVVSLSLEYTGVFSSKKRFFSAFFELSSREFDQKNDFLKNEKNFVKNLQKKLFFCSFEGGKASVSTPGFWGTPFLTLS